MAKTVDRQIVNGETYLIMDTGAREAVTEEATARENAVSDLKSELYEIGANQIPLLTTETILTVEGEYVNQAGIIMENDAYVRSFPIPVRKDDSFTYTHLWGHSGNVSVVAFYDTGMTLISNVVSTSSYQNGTAVAPQDGYVIFSHYLAYECTITPTITIKTLLIDDTLTDKEKAANAKATGDGIKNAIDSIPKIINVLAGVRFFEGYYIDASGNKVDHTNWSTSDYIPIKKEYYSIYKKDTFQNEMGMFIHGYDENKEWTAYRSVNGYPLRALFEDNDVFCRISIPTSVIEATILIKGLLFVNNQHNYLDSELLTDSWFYRTGAGDYIQTVSDNTTAEIKRYTTNYIPVEKGMYHVKIPMAQGATITTFDKEFQPVKNTNVLSTATAERLFLAEDDGYVVISYTATGSIELEKFDDWIHSFKDKKVVFYGDSITALGNDFALDSWQRLLCDAVGIENRISVGVGGSPFGYTNTSGFTLPSDYRVGDNLPTSKGVTTWEEGMPHGAFCAWDRIDATVPSDADIIFIMGGTNDGVNAWGIGDNYVCGIYNTEEHTFAHDYAWDQAEEYTGGDYDLRYILPSMLSCVMKMRVKAPNAVIVLCSPIQLPGDQSNPINHPELRNSMDDVTTAMQKVAQHTGVQFVNLHEGCEIQIYDSSRYLQDGIHPNALGKMMIARYLIGEFENLTNRFGGVSLVELN